MSTRTYTLNFTAPATLTLPSGIFFYIKSASAALNIDTRGSTTAPVNFNNVGAGLRFGPVPEAKRWTYLDVTSASVQTVEIVVSDDAEVDIASTVSVAGNVTTQELPSSALSSQAKTALATATSVDIPANAARKRITIQNWSDSAGNFCVRDQTGTADAGEEIQSGMGRMFATTAALRIRNNSGASVNYSWNEEA